MAFSFFKKNKEEKPKASGPQYYDLEVSGIESETKDAISITFRQPETKISYKSGQFLTLIVPVEGKEVRRAYSLCSSPFTDADLTVAVKRVDNGLMSNWLPDNLKVGDTMKIMEPMGVFTTEYDTSNKRHLIMFAGGSGITPMMSIIKSTLDQEPNSIISLVYANRNIESIIFKDHLDKLATDFEGRLHLIHVLDNAPMNWQGHSGLLNHDMLVQILERVPKWDETTYLMCGPEGMMKNVEQLLSEQNVDKSKIFKESFVAGTIDKPEESVEDSGDGAKEVTVIYDGEEHKFSVEPDTTILETALDMGIDLPYSCQAGLCTACRGKCLSGEVKLTEEEGLSEAELEEGYVLTCVGHPITDEVVIEIG
ncbi:MAG: ferredoxin--NADP reductase [Bacteroidota bacterium]